MTSGMQTNSTVESPVGSLALEWRTRQLGQISRIYSGGTPSRGNQSYWGGDIPWATTAEVDFGYILSTKEMITEVGLKNSAAKVAPPGTLLIAMYGQGKTRGKTAILGIHAAMNQACAAVELNKEVSTAFVFHYLEARYEYIRGMSNAGGQENLSGAIIKKIPIVIPTRAEQNRIAEVLDDLDALIDRLWRLIEKKQAIKRGMLQQLLTGRIRLPGFNAPWSQIPVSEVATITKGKQLGRAEMDPLGTVPVWNGGVAPSGFTTSANVGRSVVTVSEGGNSCGWVGRPRGAFWLGGHCYSLVPMPGTHSVSFLYHALKARESDIMALRVGSGLPNVQKRRLAEFVVSVPSDRAEGIAVADVLDDADLELEALERRLDSARAIKQGVVQELLSGRTRLQPREVEV